MGLSSGAQLQLGVPWVDLEEVPGVTSTRCPAVSSRVYQHLLLPACHTSDLAEGHRGGPDSDWLPRTTAQVACSDQCTLQE